MKSVSIQDIGGGWFLVVMIDRRSGTKQEKVVHKAAAIELRKQFLRSGK